MMVKKFSEMNESVSDETMLRQEHENMKLEMGSSQFKDLIKIDEFKDKIDVTLQDLFSGKDGTTITLKVGDDVLEIDPHSDNWELMSTFIDGIMKEDENYDEYDEFKNNMKKYTI